MYCGAISNNELLLIAPCGEPTALFVWDGAAYKLTDEAIVEHKGINPEATWVMVYYPLHDSADDLHTPRRDKQQFILLYTMQTIQLR